MQRRISRRASGVDDGGFTLVEVLVALIILALVFASTAVAVVNAARNSVVARQHQTGTALAAQAVERVRALTNGVVLAGSANAITADPAVVTTGGVSYFGSGCTSATISNCEALALNSNPAIPAATPATAGSTPLTVYPWPLTTTNGTKYTVKTFLTCKHSAYAGSGNPPPCGPVTGPSDAILYHLSVVVTWADRLGSASRQFTNSSYLYKASPSSTCDQNLPIAAPCQPVLYASAGTGKVNITLAAADQSTGGIRGLNLASASLMAGDADSSLKVERVTTTNSSANGGDASWNANAVNGNFNGSSAAGAASNDPDSGITDGPFASLSPLAFTKTFSSGTNSLVLSQDAVTGSAVASSAASTSPVCNDAGVSGSASQQTNGQACGNGSVTLGGLHAVANVNDNAAALGSWPLLDLVPAPSTSSVWTGRMGTGWNGHCTSPSTDGCASGAAKRTVGSLTLGGLPATLAVAAANAHLKWDTSKGLVSLTGYSDSATSEAGVTASSVAGPAATGTLSYWIGTGNGYTTAPLIGGSAISIPALSVTSGTTMLTEVGIITPGTAPTPTTAIGTCASTPCTANAAVHGPIIDITYTVVVNSVTVVSLQLHADLGGVTTSATYQSGPSAS